MTSRVTASCGAQPDDLACGAWSFGSQDGQLEMRDLPAAVLLAGTVLVRVVAAGVCGSDLHMWRNTQSWPTRLPVTLGHETAGVAESVGDGVGGWRVGDRVVCETAASICGCLRSVPLRPLQPVPVA